MMQVAATTRALGAGGCDNQRAKHGQEEPPHVQGQRQQPRVPDCNRAGTAERSYPASEVPGGDERSYPVSEVRGGGQEELPHTLKPEARGGGREKQPTQEARGGGRQDQPYVQGAVAARVQEGLEELSHVEGQEGRR